MDECIASGAPETAATVERIMQLIHDCSAFDVCMAAFGREQIVHLMDDLAAAVVHFALCSTARIVHFMNESSAAVVPVTALATKCNVSFMEEFTATTVPGWTFYRHRIIYLITVVTPLPAVNKVHFMDSSTCRTKTTATSFPS